MEISTQYYVQEDQNGSNGSEPGGLKAHDAFQLQEDELKVDGKNGKLSNNGEDVVGAEVAAVVIEMCQNPLPQISLAIVKNYEVESIIVDEPQDHADYDGSHGPGCYSKNGEGKDGPTHHSVQCAQDGF